MDVELLKSTIESLGGRYDDLPENDVDALRKRLIEVCAGLKGGGGSSGGGLPSGGAPHQVLVTDKKGTAGWQDRLCYETQEEMVFLPETVMVAADGMFMGNVPVVKGIVAGDTYPVNYNGAAYNCVAQTPPDGGSYFAFGNLGVMAEGFPITEDPFILMVAQLGENLTGMEGVYTMLMPLDGATAVTVSIRGIAEQVKKIDTKYAPGYVFGEIPYKDRVFLKETTISGQNVQITFDAPLVPDQIYTVTHNGTAYTVAPEESSALSNAFKLEVYKEGEGAVFSLHVPYSNLSMGMLMSNKSSTFTLSIVGSGVETVKVPSKLLETPPFVVTVKRSETTIESVSHTYEQIKRAYNAGCTLFCLLIEEDFTTVGHLIPMSHYSSSGEKFVFCWMCWGYADNYIVTISSDGNTLKKETPALSKLRITSAGGLTLKSSNGTEFKLTVSDDGTLTATAL